MKKLIAAIAASATLPALAGVPLNDFQGSGGVGYNPIAYLAGIYSDDAKEGTNTENRVEKWISRPQAGAWEIAFHEIGVSWTSLSAAFSIADRLELSYAYGLIYGVGDFTGTSDEWINTHTLGTKALVLPENLFKQPYLPAISVGAKWKYTDADLADALGLDSSGADFYAVATKLIKELPVPVLLSAGLEYTDSFVYGVVGHNDYGLAPFGSITLIPVRQLAVGFEYKGGADIGSGLENHSYYNVHVAWFITEKLTAVGAYGWTGKADPARADDFGLGQAAVASLQYQF